MKPIDNKYPYYQIDNQDFQKGPTNDLPENLKDQKNKCKKIASRLFCWGLGPELQNDSGYNE